MSDGNAGFVQVRVRTHVWEQLRRMQLEREQELLAFQGKIRPGDRVGLTDVIEDLVKREEARRKRAERRSNAQQT